MRKLKRKLKKVTKKLVPILGFIPVVGTAITVGVVVAKARRNAKDEKIAKRAGEAEAVQAGQAENAPVMDKAKKFFAPVADFFDGLTGVDHAPGTSPVKSSKIPLIIGVALVFGLLGFLFMRKR